VSESSDSEPREVEPESPPGVPERLVFRTPGSALLAAALAAVCAVPFAFAAPGLVAIFVVPLAYAVWVVRVRTVADTQGLTVRRLVGGDTLPWSSLSGLRLTQRGAVRAVRTDGTEVALPSVRTRHLSALSLVSAGHLADPMAEITE
jgi:hypothetical protein